jgi:RHS repeat-associated protein
MIYRDLTISHLNATIFSSPLVDKYVKASSSWDNDAAIACNGDPSYPSLLDGIVKIPMTYGGYIFSHGCVPRYTNLDRSLVEGRCDEYYLSHELYGSIGLSRYSCQHGLNLTSGECNTSGGGNNANDTNKLKNIGSCESVGNPINPNIGNKLQVETDYTGTGLFPLALTRTYNSVWLTSGAANIANLPKSLGAGWMGNYNTTVIYDNNTAGTVLPKATVIRANGRVLNFTQTATNIFQPDADIQDKLIRLASGWKYIRAATETTEIYDTAGKLLSISNRAGATQTLTYSNGLLQTVTDPTGRQLAFTYDTANRVKTITVPSGGVYSYGYQTSGALTSITYPDSKQRVYHYEDTRFPTHLTGITDENGNRFATYTYNDQGKAGSSEHAGGVNRVTLNYANDSTDVTDALGASKTYSFQTILGMVKTTGLTQPCTSCGGSNKSTSYDDNGNVKSRTDFSGNRTNYTYDLSRNLETRRVEGLDAAEATTPVTRTITTEWHPTWRLPKRIAEPLKITTYVYHGDNGVSCGATGSLCTKTIQPTTDVNGALGFNAAAASEIARSWSYTYNSLGQILTENASRTDVNDLTTYTYYTDNSTTHRIGDLWSITNALGQVTQITNYNAEGRPLSIKNANGVVTTLTYTPRGKLKTLVIAGGFTTTYTYDDVGQLTNISLPDGRAYTYGYDTAHRLTSLTSKTGEKLTYTLDNAGNHLAETFTDAAGIVTTEHRQEFDVAGQLYKSITNVQGVDAITKYTYDADGNLKEETSPTARVMTYDYDALTRLVQTQTTLNDSPIIAKYSYNGQDASTQTTAPNNATTSQSVNGFGETGTETSPDRGTTTYTYDSAGNTKTVKDARGITLTYTYDALNRLITVTAPTATQNITYTYDSNTTLTSCLNGKGRLCKVVDQSGTTAFAYDTRGNVTKRAYQTGGITYTTTFVYDAGNKLLAINLPGSRSIVYGVRDNERRLQEVLASVNGAYVNVLSGASYRPDGQASSLTYGNGETVTYSYDKGGRRTTSLRSIANANESITWNLEEEVAERTSSAVTRTYKYDTLSRLFQETGSPVSQSFDYDANGNRKSNASNLYTYLLNSNRMATRKGVTLMRDAAGNHTSNGLGQTYEWDNHGHLSQFNLSGVKKATYLYNHQHLRSHKMLWNGATAQDTTVYHYDLAGRLLMETNSVGAVQAFYVYDDSGTPLAVVQVANGLYNTTAQDRLLYLHTDHLGTPRRATDSAKRSVWQWESDAFGTTAAQQDPDADSKATVINLRFAGQYFDAESGLHQNWHRTYDPSLGRYISSDPIGLDGGLNTYGYVGQSPLVLVDPNGLCPVCIGALAFLGEAGTTTTAVIGTATIGAAAYGIASTQNALNEMSQSSVWGDGMTDHPSHADENDALAIPLSATCEELAWAINVLQAAIEWRKEDIRRYGGNNARAPGHRQRINILQNELDKLSREFNLRCGKQCSKD